MATQIDPSFPSEALTGLGIKVVQTASPGTTIHTGSSTATDIDEVTIYACNTDTYSRTLTIQWGGTTHPDNSIVIVLAPQDGLKLVVPALPLKGAATPLVIKAFASAANVVIVHAKVERIS